eukprot:EG_transcript_9592
MNSFHWNEPRVLRTCQTREHMLARARNNFQRLFHVALGMAGLQFCLMKEDMECVLSFVRSLPGDPSDNDNPQIPNGAQLLLSLRDHFGRVFHPWTLPATKPVTLDHCRSLLLKVCRKVMVRLRPTCPEMESAVRLFRQQLTECVRWYATKPDAFDADVARGLVKLVRKSRLHFVDQCGNPHCGKSESSPQEHKRCSACAWVKYCSKDCQRSDWTKHREICTVLHQAIYPTLAQP